MIARMWEVRAAPQAVDELLAWLCESVLPAIESQTGHLETKLYRSQDRVVAISHWQSGDPISFPAPPQALVERPPHSWDFTPVTR